MYFENNLLLHLVINIHSNFLDKYHNLKDYFVDYLGIPEQELYEIRESLLDKE